ncbi:MAG: hypothetical protein ACLQVJ_29230 [Syntrophobacteraceae bacterium]
MMLHFGRSFSTVFLIVALAGCSSLGPASIIRDRFDYSTAISDSWKTQMLMNLVNLRYADPPVFLDVASVISQYELDSLANLALTFTTTNVQSAGGTVSYTDRPTITYNLLSGDKFARSLMTPIPPESIMSLIEAGWPAELVLRLAVHSINGIPNRSGGALRGRAADPRFYMVIEALGRVQRSGAVGIRVQPEKKSDGAALIVFARKTDESVEPDRRLIRETLGLDPQTSEFTLTFGLVPRNDREIAILSRSMLDILVELSGNIEVPEVHVSEKRTFPTREEDVFEGRKVQSLMRILSGKEKPADAFVMVRNRGYWYWLDDRDFISKRIFGIIMFLFTLTEKPEKEGVPIVTIPTR